MKRKRRGFKYNDELFITGRIKDLIIINGFNHYASDILKKFNVVNIDFDSNPKLFAGKFFDALAYGATRFGEFDIQSSMFLGQMTKEEYNSFEYNNEGELEFKKGVNQKEFKEKMVAIKNKISDVQGKYAEKDQRNIMRGELGKTAFQFKQWSFDWWKERLGEKYITRDNKVHEGNYRSFILHGIKDLKADIKDKGFYNGTKDNEAFMKTIKEVAFIAFLLTLKYSDDDDEKTKRKVLSLENTLGNLVFLFDPEQLKFTIKQPVAAMGTLYKMADAFSALVQLDAKGIKQKGAKIIPYKKTAQSIDEFFGSE